MTSALPGGAILSFARALSLIGLAYRLRRARRLALSGRYREGERVAERLLFEMHRFRERSGVFAGSELRELRR